MELEKPYVIIRKNENSFFIVHEADKIKDARYWLNYIAEPNDALCKTPKHPKYKGTGNIEYQAHLVNRGEVNYNKEAFENLIGKTLEEIKLEAKKD